MATLFEDFTKWHTISSQSQAVLSNIRAKKFDPEKDRNRATGVLVEMLKESGETEEEAHAQAAVFQRDSEESDIEGIAKAGKGAYELKINELFSAKFSDFYDSTPKGVREEVYSLLEHTKPKPDLSALSGDMKKAAELHSIFGGLGTKIDKYLHGRVQGAESKDIEKEVNEKLFEYYDKKFMDTPERAATFGKMVEVLKKWAKKKPRRGIAVYHSIYEKNKEEFNKLITKDNLKEYLTLAIDSNELAKLYASANAIYEQSQGRKRSLESSGMLPIFSE